MYEAGVCVRLSSRSERSGSLCAAGEELSRYARSRLRRSVAKRSEDCVVSKLVECGLVRSAHGVSAGAEGCRNRAGDGDKLGMQASEAKEGELRRSQISLVGVSENDDCR
jgi:hypothetical protein